MFKLTIDGDRDWRNAISFAERTGEERKGRLFVQYLISTTDFNDEKIAELTSVSVDFVKRMRTKN